MVGTHPSIGLRRRPPSGTSAWTQRAVRISISSMLSA
jgi:hypothetical protein